jgi:tRNA-dihydrouridine synthase A
MSGYARKRCVQGDYISRITRHMLGLFHGQPGGRVWRRHLSEEAHKPGAGPEVIKAGVQIVSDIQAVCEAAQ